MKDRSRPRWKLVSLVALLAGGAASACSVDARSPQDGEELADETGGSVGLQLRLGDVTLASVSYVITGNGFVKNGTIDVSKSRTISSTIGGIPAGTGYSLTLSATDATDSRILCNASASFNVVARATTVTNVKLECRLPHGNGSVQIDGSANVCPRIDSLSVEPSEVLVGGTMALSAVVTDADALPVPASLAWSANGGLITGPTAAAATFKCTEAGSFAITLAVSDTACGDSVSANVVCTADETAPPRPNVKINEIESNGGTPGDWTELYNADSVPADISGWTFKDNDDTHVYTVPAGTIIPPGGYFIVEEAAQGFGLGGADSARLFDALGLPVDSHTWAAHATVTYGRCANGSGDFIQTPSTKGLVNTCAPVVPSAAVWPGTNDVKTLDVATQFTSNLSGLTYEAASASSPAVLWAVVNGPGTLQRLLWNGTNYLPDTANDWSLGKALRYPDGTGNPDSEGVTLGANVSDGIYVATERNNDASTVSKLAVLRFDPNAAGTSLTATHEWNLTSLLPVVGANLGLEAITWVPDSYLVAKGFFDEAAGHTYAPSEYASHGTGLFFIGIEGTGKVYAFALNHLTGAASLVATITTGQTGVMSLEFDREVGYLWFGCDDTCGNKTGIFDVDSVAGSATQGRFTLRRLFERPSTLPDSNNEGIAITPQSECVAGFKPFFWSDDSDKDTFSLRKDSIPCGSFL
jgi:hypothetical protein